MLGNKLKVTSRLIAEPECSFYAVGDSEIEQTMMSTRRFTVTCS